MLNNYVITLADLHSLITMLYYGYREEGEK